MDLFDKLVKTFTGDKGDGDKDYWVDDTKVRACYECETQFSLLVRRHHCRICGRIFCGKCTRHIVQTAGETEEEARLRVCNYCKYSGASCDTLMRLILGHTTWLTSHWLFLRQL